MIEQFYTRTVSCAVWWRLSCVLKFQVTFFKTGRTNGSVFSSLPIFFIIKEINYVF